MDSVFSTKAFPLGAPAVSEGSRIPAAPPRRRVAAKRAGRAVLVAALFASGIGICLASGVSVSDAMEGFSYSTLALIVSMDVFTSLMAETGAMEWIAVRIAKLSRGGLSRLIAALAAFMFLVSALMNNITAVLCILPCAFVILRAVSPARTYLLAFFAVVLSMSNLGGAATAVGDLPAILIMNTGVVTFSEYTFLAFPLCALCAAAVVCFWVLLLRSKGVKGDEASSRLALGILDAQYRYVRVDAAKLVPLLAILAAMLACWIAVPQSSMGPEVIAVVGCAVAVAVCRLQGGTPALSFDMGNILTIAAFLFFAAAVNSSGILLEVASTLRGMAPDDKTYLLLVLVLSSVIAGFVGAGPAAAVCLPIVLELAEVVFPLSRPVVMVAYGAAICAGSSLFMWSATAGFILSGKIEQGRLADEDGLGFSWGIPDYLPFGIANYVIQMAVAILFACLFV